MQGDHRRSLDHLKAIGNELGSDHVEEQTSAADFYSHRGAIRLFRSRVSEQSRNPVQLRAPWPLAIVWTEAQAKAVLLKSRKDVEVHVKDLLTRCGSIRQKKINPFAANPASAQPRRHQHADTKNLSAEFRSEIREVNGMGL
jgi:hypothetical protein